MHVPREVLEPQRDVLLIVFHYEPELANLVFITTIGAQKVVNCHIKTILKRARLAEIRRHGLRHNYITILLARGMHSPSTFSTSHGTPRFTFTLDRYTHLMLSIGRNSTNRMDEPLG